MKKGWQAGISVVGMLVGAGFLVFIGLGCEIGKGYRAGYGISIPA